MPNCLPMLPAFSTTTSRLTVLRSPRSEQVMSRVLTDLRTGLMKMAAWFERFLLAMRQLSLSVARRW